MKRVTPADYKADKLYPRVARAMDELLANNLPVSAPAVFVKIGMLSDEHLQAWRAGRVPYLERVIAGSLGKTSRVVRIISFYAHDLKLPSAPPHSAGRSGARGTISVSARLVTIVLRRPTSAYSAPDRLTGRRSQRLARRRMGVRDEPPNKELKLTKPARMELRSLTLCWADQQRRQVMLEWRRACSTIVLLAMCSAEMRCVAAEPRGQSEHQAQVFWQPLSPPAGFTLAERLACRTQMATHQAMVGREFQIAGVRGSQPTVGSKSPKPMPPLQHVADRLVLQLVGEDAGSVDTVLLDTKTGEFARQWSGWDQHGKLSVGAERGLCKADEATMVRE